VPAFEIDPGSPVPPSEQLVRAVRRAVAAGRLAGGERLPSVRKLAAEVLLNPNTVSKAYLELEREGTLTSRPGAGVYVAPGARERCARLRDAELSAELARLVRAARAGGVQADDLRALLERCIGDDEMEQAS
jgi:GntR family transcriptional regulator